MKTEISQVPEKGFEIKQVGVDAHVFFFENAQEVTREESVSYECDTYKLVVPFRPGLEKTIEANLSVWMNAAKAQETVAPQKTVEERVSTVEEVVTTLAEVVLL